MLFLDNCVLVDRGEIAGPVMVEIVLGEVH